MKCTFSDHHGGDRRRKKCGSGMRKVCLMKYCNFDGTFCILSSPPSAHSFSPFYVVFFFLIQIGEMDSWFFYTQIMIFKKPFY